MSNTHPTGTIQPQSALESFSGSFQPHDASENRNLPETMATEEDIIVPNGMDDDSMTTKPSRTRGNSLEDVGLLPDISF